MKKVCKQTYVAKYFYNRFVGEKILLTETEMDYFFHDDIS